MTDLKVELEKIDKILLNSQVRITQAIGTIANARKRLRALLDDAAKV